MTIQLAIIGLGQIGTSVGLALAEHKKLIRRVGYDGERGIAGQAEKMGALDKVVHNLTSAIKEAHVVLLALPVDQVRDTLALIGGQLKEGTVVMETSPAKEAVAGWVKELLPTGRYYLGLTPILNPAFLTSQAAGLEAAHADLFRGGMMAVVIPPGVPADAIKLATDLIHLLGAEHLFCDPAEVDSLMAATHLLPQLMAAALLDITVDRPGWREGRKIAGRAYTEVTGPAVHLDEAEALANAALLTKPNIVRLLDSLIASLHTMRTEIQDENKDALLERLICAREGRLRWWQQRQAGNWIAEENRSIKIPTSGEVMGRMVGMTAWKRPKAKQ